jgi:hypothetical protein
MQNQVNATPAPKRVPWNKGKLTGAKPPRNGVQQDVPLCRLVPIGAISNASLELKGELRPYSCLG